MKDVLKFTLSCFITYIVMLVIAFLFAGTLAHENPILRWISFGVMFAIMNGVAFFEGGSRGEADSALARRLEKRRENRDEDPTKAELDKCYKKWKGAVAAFLSVSPVILLSLYMLIGPSNEWFTPIMRILLWPYVPLFMENISVTWYYFPLTLIFPLAITIGYLMGPKRFAKLLRSIHENDRKRRAKSKKKKTRGMQR